MDDQLQLFQVSSLHKLMNTKMTYLVQRHEAIRKVAHLGAWKLHKSRRMTSYSYFRFLCCLSWERNCAFWSRLNRKFCRSTYILLFWKKKKKLIKTLESLSANQPEGVPGKNNNEKSFVWKIQQIFYFSWKVVKISVHTNPVMEMLQSKKKWWMCL